MLITIYHAVVVVAVLTASPPDVVLVPAGQFIMGGDGSFSHKKAAVSLDAFYIDKFEVTNQQYKRFIDQTKRRPPGHWVEGTFPRGMEKYPVYGVSWEDAVAYARWAGKRLPTEAEWEKAARGTDGLLYPWGDKPDPKKCNAYESKARQGTYGPDSLDPVDAHADGVSPYGAYNMTGNVWEWVATESGNGGHLLCGGSCGKYIFDIPVTRRSAAGGVADDVGYTFIGFRCAKDAAR